MTAEDLVKLTVRETENYRCYDQEELLSMMDSEERRKFGAFMYGQTGPIIDGKFYVYEHDVLRFFEKKAQIPFD